MAETATSGAGFTPGPWELHTPPHDIRDAHVISAQGAGVARVSRGSGIANARLIAAAPELYEAAKSAIPGLQYAIKHFLQDDDTLRQIAELKVAALQAALAKAAA